MRNFAFVVAVPAFFAAVFSMPQTLSAADDTFSCLPQFSGSRVDLSGNHGYANVQRPTWDSETIFDARGATWQHQTVPDRPEQENWLALLGGAAGVPAHSPACWAGSIFTGTNSPNEPWVKMKKQGGEAITLNSNHGVVDGVRIDNIGEDGIGMINGGNWTIKDSWISRIFDDCEKMITYARGKSLTVW